MSRWFDFRYEIKSRVNEPFSFPSFIFYFILCIVGIAGFGHYIEVYNELLFDTGSASALIKSLTTFCITLSSVAFIDVLIKRKKDEISKDLIMFFTLFFFIIMTISISMMLHLKNYYFLCTPYSLSILFWWLINAKDYDLTDPGYRDNAVPEASHVGTKPINDYKV